MKLEIENIETEAGGLRILCAKERPNSPSGSHTIHGGECPDKGRIARGRKAGGSSLQLEISFSVKASSGRLQEEKQLSLRRSSNSEAKLGRWGRHNQVGNLLKDQVPEEES